MLDIRITYKERDELIINKNRSNVRFFFKKYSKYFANGTMIKYEAVIFGINVFFTKVR